MDSYYILDGKKLTSTDYLSSGGKILFPDNNTYLALMRLFENACEKHSLNCLKSITEDFAKNEFTIKKCCSNFKADFNNVNDVKIKYEL